MPDKKELEKKCIDTIRFLAADAIERAKSGHPGMPLGAAAAAFTLWTKHLKHNPKNPRWPDRDRFVLSAGHASMLLYALLHLTGYDLTLDDIKNFRQWGSRTPGHPEYKHTPGVEVTTGPLGQGLANAVGMAIAEAHLAARFNKGGEKIVDHFTYVMASDGDMMEGVVSEAGALAGHLRLGKLIVLYDDNKVTLAGSAGLSFTENIELRFKSYGWQVIKVADGNDVAAIDKAIKKAQRETEKPSLICVSTTIGYGAPCKQGSCDAHGSPLGAEELQKTKEALGWDTNESFNIREDVRKYFRKALARGKKQEKMWQENLTVYRQKHPALAAELERVTRGVLPEDWDAAINDFPADAKGVATRKASETVMQSIAAKVPELIGGSADLNPSTFTWLKKMGDFQSPSFPPDGLHGMVGGAWNYEGRNIHFGVREHAMGSVSVGMALHGGLIPYTATFLTFADYMRPPMRLAALMGLRVIFVFTHDSIGVGEDGPTHQPVEQIMNLRQVPNMTVLRPADANETLEAWRIALTNNAGPTTLIFSRQNLPILDRSVCAPASGTNQGGYTIWESSPEPDIIFIATGSEVSLALDAAKKLSQEGIKIRVVSLPSWEIFDRQPRIYREKVLPPRVMARIAIEAGIKLGWEHYLGLEGETIGMKSFGASAPGPVLFEKFGFTVENVIGKAKELLKSQKK
ncbi:MAG TPA: transketolase [Smithellaceae bacterium]|nr:transketolase [Smithellaceae bacterium]HRS88780.1 transketolase [Smithellaceae bacterium]HRV25783.1 transketolase [Smithellaceae bacterium]